MSAAHGPVFFDCCRAAIAELIETDAGMDVVECTIDAYALERDEKDALWLWAAGRRTRSPRRAVSVAFSNGTRRIQPELVCTRHDREDA